MKKLFLVVVALLLLLPQHSMGVDTVPLRAHIPQPKQLIQSDPPVLEVAAVIDGPLQTKVGDLVILDASKSRGASTYAWTLASSQKTFLTVEGGKKVVFASGTPGSYEFILAVAGLDSNKNVVLDQTSFVVTIGEPTPPIPPTPPTPPPPPTPVEPAPIPLPGFRAAIIYENDELGSFTREQANIYGSPAIRAYLNENAVKSPDGKTPDWRLLEKDTQMQFDYPHWQAAMKLKRDSNRWVIISNGKTGFSGPWPETESAFLDLLKKYKEAQ